jgi:hypothetical protein
MSTASEHASHNRGTAVRQHNSLSAHHHDHTKRALKPPLHAHMAFTTLKRQLSSDQLCCDLSLHRNARSTRHSTCDWTPNSHNESPSVRFNNCLRRPPDPDMRFEGLAGLFSPALKSRSKAVRGPGPTRYKAQHCCVLHTITHRVGDRTRACTPPPHLQHPGCGEGVKRAEGNASLAPFERARANQHS